MHHSQVVKSTILNDCLKVNIDDHTKKKIVSKLLVHVSIRELHNSLVSESDYDGLKKAKDADNNIIISDYKLSSLLPPQL